MNSELFLDYYDYPEAPLFWASSLALVGAITLATC